MVTTARLLLLIGRVLSVVAIMAAEQPSRRPLRCTTAPKLLGYLFALLIIKFDSGMELENRSYIYGTGTVVCM